MKQKHLLALLQQNMTTVQIQFLADYRNGSLSQPMPAAPPMPMPRGAKQAWEAPAAPMPWHDPAAANPGVKVYTYKAPLNLLTEGDTVLVQDDSSPYGLSLGRVHHVDPVARIDVDADFDYKWIVQRVDTTEYTKRVHDERQFADTMQAVEATRQREELVKSMVTHLPEGTEARAQFDAAIALYKQPVRVAAPANPVGVDGGTHEAYEGMQCK